MPNLPLKLNQGFHSSRRDTGWRSLPGHRLAASSLLPLVLLLLVPLDPSRDCDYEQGHMHTEQKRNRRRFFLLSLALVLVAPAAFGGDWTVVRQRDRSHVTFANVAHSYQFPECTRLRWMVSLRSERRVIRAQAGTSELSINGVRFFTNFPLLSSEDDDLISVMDVSKIIEPVLRPSWIRNAERIETVAQGIQNYDAAVNYRAGMTSFAAARTNSPPHARPVTEPLGSDKPAGPNPVHPPSVSIHAGE